MADANQIQVWIDRDYEGGMTALRSLLASVAPQVEPFDTLQGLVSQIDNYIAGFIRGDRWTIEKWREEYKLLMDQNSEHVAELNRRGTALQRIALMADTGSDVYKRFAEPYLKMGDKPSGWRIAEEMRQIANDVIGNEPICDSCGGEGQVQLTDEGGSRMWWACPACRPLEQVRTMTEEPREMPERVEGDGPECPWCNRQAERPSWLEWPNRKEYDCPCGGRFEAERESKFVSRPMKYRR